MAELFTSDGQLYFLLFAVYVVWLESSQVQCRQLCGKTADNKAENVSLNVRTIVTPSAILLICSGNTSGGQFLKWTERGKNIPAAAARTYRHFNVSTATEEVSVVFNNPGVFDYGIFTCHCYNSYNMAGDSGKSAERKHLRSRQQIMRQNRCSYPCSEPVSVSALPSESISVVEHFFKSKRRDELIQISCQNRSQLLASSRRRSMTSADSSSSIIDEPLIGGRTILKWPHYVSAKSPSSERKYICLGLKRNLEEIHYLITPSDISSISLPDVTPPTSSPTLSFPTYISTQFQSSLIARSTISSTVRRPRSELIVTQLLQPPTTIISDSDPAATDQQSLIIIYAVSTVTAVIVLVSVVVLVLLLCYVRKLCRSIAEHSTPSQGIVVNGYVQQTAAQDNVYVITPSV